MRIDIQSLGFPLTAALVRHTEYRLRVALTRISDRIKHVVVRLGDNNGPRGGKDKFCRMRVHVDRSHPVQIEDTGVDLYAVIDRVAERAGRNAGKRVDRLREHVRLPMRPPLPQGETLDEFHNRGL